ncbi:dual specificity protein phosphatase 22-like isoform X2 [Acanthaster planci]|uniref:Dual specificity protein phosphatase 15 n=1 Tax=Acanthaster planci TaxID=133434 RepID=A0A8B7Z5R2_ACAPL|nr:dual specificity protein phosphatase 22-like isoform X2 [Acanthaster planci]
MPHHLCCLAGREDPPSWTELCQQTFREAFNYCPIRGHSMGIGMSEIIPGLYVGNFRDAKDQEALHNNRITHIVTIHDHAKVPLPHIEYLTLNSPDNPTANISQFFHKATEFIHECRIHDGRVLVHCIAGVSRSVTIAVAYLMSVTDHGWRDCLRAVKQARQVANPNFGFQRQLQNFENTELKEVRKRIKERYSDTLREQDTSAIQQLLDKCNQKPESKDPEEDLYPLAYNAYASQPPGDMPPLDT